MAITETLRALVHFNSTTSPADMEGLASSRLQSFREDVLGYRIQIFGNVAVAVAGCRITENETTEGRSVEMMLLTKEDGVWRIVAQAWDNESDSKKLPPELAGP